MGGHTVYPGSGQGRRGCDQHLGRDDDVGVEIDAGPVGGRSAPGFECEGLATLRQVDQTHRRRIAGDDLGCSIGAAVAYDDHVEARATLVRQDGIEGPTDDLLLVVRRNDDRTEHPVTIRPLGRHS